MLIPFAGYGFNKSHAAGYAILAYRTAYLKAHFPGEFMAANLSNEIHSADKNKLSECISEGRRMGLSIGPPDINRSEKYFSAADGAIVFGFLGIKGIGSGPIEEILEKRKDGPYLGFMDFLDRVTLQTNQQNQQIVSRKVIELLIKTGAFDSFGINRPTLLANMEAAADYAQNKKNEGKFGQVSLFGESGEKTFPDFVFSPMPEMDRMELLETEKELIGFYFSGHPLDAYKDAWNEYVKLNTADLANAAAGSYILIGILKSIKITSSKAGKQMAFGVLEDFRGEIELVFFDRYWEQIKDRVNEKACVAFNGRLDRSRPGLSFQVTSILDLPKMQKSAAKNTEKAPDKTAVPPPPLPELHIRLSQSAAKSEKSLYPLRDYLIDHPGAALVFLHINGKTIRTDVTFAAESEQIAELGENPLVAEVWVA